MGPVAAIWHLSEASFKARREERYTRHLAQGPGSYPVAILALYPRGIADPTAVIVDATGQIDEVRIQELQVVDDAPLAAIQASRSWMAANTGG
jgi:hypothetical protein